MATPMVNIKGRIERKEFREPFRQCTETLEGIGAVYQINPAMTEEPMDFALFFQSYPHEFAQSEMTHLRQLNPFTPFFFVLGTCCEGMLRTAGPLDSPFYCYSHGWNSNGTGQIRRFLTDQPSVFSLPLTAEQDEIAVFTSGAGSGAVLCVTSGCVPTRIKPASFGGVPPTLAALENGTKFSGNILILTQFGPFGNDSAMNLLIADEQRQLGYAPIFFSPLSATVCRLPIIADADNSPRDRILDSIQSLRQQFADNDFTVYVDSPRIDEKNDYLQAGVTRVLTKIR